jgi:hypothetical protein
MSSLASQSHFYTSPNLSFKIWPIQLAFFLLIACRIFPFWFTLCKTSSFLTRQAKFIFFVLHQQHISKLCRYFWSTFRSIQFSTSYKAKLQIYHFSGFFLKFQSNSLAKELSSCWILLGPWQSWIKFHAYILHHSTSLYQNIWNTPYS